MIGTGRRGRRTDRLPATGAGRARRAAPGLPGQAGPPQSDPRAKPGRLPTPLLPYACPVTPVELSRTVLRAVRRAVDEGELSVAVPERAVVARAGARWLRGLRHERRPAAGPARRAAARGGRRDPAGAARGRAGDRPASTITGPGFLNITPRRRRGAAALVARDPAARRAVRARRRARRTSSAAARTPARSGAVAAEAVARRRRGRLAPRAPSVRTPAATDRADLDAAARASVGVRRRRPRRPPARRRPSTSTSGPYPAPADPTPLGRDAARWALLHPAAHDRPRISAEHLVQRESNPLFRVRYAHARTRALSRNAAALGFTRDPGDVRDDADAAARRPPSPTTPAILATAARHRAPTVSPGTSSPSPTPCSPSCTTVLPRRRARNPRPPTVPGSRLPKPPGRCWPAACPCSASTHPNISEHELDESPQTMSRSAHPAGPRHADVLPEGHYSAPPADLNALDPKVWAQTVTP